MKLNFKKFKKLKNRHDFLEPEEVLFNKEALSRLEPEEDIQRLEVKTGIWGLRAVVYLCGFFMVVVFGWIIYLGIIKGDYFKKAAERNSLKFISVPAERGLIYDRYRKPLLSNQPVFDLVFLPNYLPQDLKHRHEFFQKIESLGFSSADLEKEIKNPNRPFLGSVILKSDLSNQEAISLESVFAGYPAVQIVKQNIRNYFFPEAFSHLLGYLGRVSAEDLKNDSNLLDFGRIGKSGLEAYYDKELRGKSGKMAVLRNANMEIVGQSFSEKAEKGQDLVLTIDKEFQEYLYNRIGQQIAKMGGNRGAAAVALDSQSGEVLAMVSYPGFNSNTFSSGIKQKEFEVLLDSPSKPLFDRVLLGTYNPGSTIKPLVAAAALEEKIIDPNRKIETHGYLSIPNPYNPDQPTKFVDWKNHGSINLYDAIARSSNVYFYMMGGGFGDFKGLGINRLSDYFKKFGLQNLTGIDAFGEKTGFVPEPNKKIGDPWNIGDTYHTSIGQGDVLATPLEMTVAYNSLVNSGKILQPHLLLAKSDDGGKNIIPVNQKVIGQAPVSLEVLDIIRKAMVQTVSNVFGTGHSLADLPFSLGGKSGTAQIASNTKLNALFFSFAPGEKPKISLLVLIENVKDGSLNAIPVVHDALFWYYKNRGL